MEKSEYQLDVEAIQETYHFLNLTFEQAEHVLKFETIKKTSSSKQIMSVWEEWDYELLIFDGILNEDQRIRFEDTRKELYARYTENFTRQDEESARWTDFHRAIRLSKTFAPNRFKQAMLAHYTQCLLPDYWAFECAMDVPTKAVAQFLKERLYRQGPEIEEFQSQKLREFREFNRLNYEKYHQPISGWHSSTLNPFTPEDEKVHWAMSLLLLDVKAYGFAPVD